MQQYLTTDKPAPAAAVPYASAGSGEPLCQVETGTDEEDEGLKPTYKVWPGKNVFFCKGKFATGPQPSYILMSLALFAIPSAVYFPYAVPYLNTKTSSVVSSVIPAMILSAGVVFLFLASFTEPGILPRQNPLAHDVPIETAVAHVIVNINGAPIHCKWCETCRFFRPPRSKHCKSCDNCIQRFDHHCPWISNCVGLRNYRYFFWFSAMTALYSAYVAIAVCASLVCLTKASPKHCSPWSDAGMPGGADDPLNPSSSMLPGQTEGSSWEWGDILTTMACHPLLAFLVIYSLIACIPTINLLNWHIFVIVQNSTTNEQLKGMYLEHYCNPFDRGVKHNFKEFLFGKMPQSLVNWQQLTPVSSVNTGQRRLRRAGSRIIEIMEVNRSQFAAPPRDPVVGKDGKSPFQGFKTMNASLSGTSVAHRSARVLEI